MDSCINDVAGQCRCSSEDVATLDVEQVISAEMGHATRENIMFGYQRGTRNEFSEMEITVAVTGLMQFEVIFHSARL
jgi:hypothetical protein